MNNNENRIPVLGEITEPGPRCYTVKDLMTMLNLSRPSVYALLARKEFKWFQISKGRYRISRRSFDAWLDGQMEEDPYP